MKTLVIGGTGPTGPFIVEGLVQRGHQVTVLHRGQHEAPLPPIEHLHVDPHFPETLAQGLADRRFDLAVVTYGRTRHIARLLRGRVDRLIAIGGMPYAAFVHGLKDPPGPPVPVAEDEPLVTEEAVNKFIYLMTITEQAVMEGHHEGHYAATILRYPLIYSPRELAPREWSIVRRLLDGRPAILVPDDGLKLLSRGYAQNMAHAVLLAVDHPDAAAGKIYNVRDERMFTLREWVWGIAQAMGKSCEIVSIPFELARPTRAYAGRAHHEALDISRIQADLGYRDVVSAEEALRRAVHWLLDNPPERGGDTEARLNDPFDYDLEDWLLQRYQRFVRETRQALSGGFTWRHPYDHPKDPQTPANG